MIPKEIKNLLWTKATKMRPFCHSSLGPVIDKVKRVVKKCTASPKLNDLVPKYVKQDLGHELTLKKDSKTRWSSLLLMLESILKLKSSLQTVWIDTSLSDWGVTLSEIDFYTVDMLVKALTPVKNTVEASQYELPAQNIW